MKILVGLGVVGKNDTSWGQAADGSPVLLVRTPEASLRVEFTGAECIDHGNAAIYLGMAQKLAAPSPGEAARPASLLVGADGAPL